jgi:hypothetical protein
MITPPCASPAPRGAGGLYDASELPVQEFSCSFYERVIRHYRNRSASGAGPGLWGLGGPGTGLVPDPSSGAGTENALIHGNPLPDDCSKPSRLPFLHCRRFIPDQKNLSRVRKTFSIKLRKKKIRKIFKIIFFGNVFPVNLTENIPLLKKIMALRRARTHSFPGSRARSSRTQPALSGIRYAEVP